MTQNTKPTFLCQRCGRCCLWFSNLTALPEDIERWRKQGRDDILQYADLEIYRMIGEADLWIHPETGKELFRCPFLRKVRNKPVYRCKIYETRPLQCQSFPQLQYDEAGELTGAHGWAVENCPGVQALLKDWPPERVRALRDGKMIKRGIVGGSLDDIENAEARRHVNTCAWCDRQASEGEQVYLLGATVRHKNQFEGQEGKLVPLALREKTIQAFVTLQGSEARSLGWDLGFTACSLECARSLQAALRQETDLIGEVSA